MGLEKLPELPVLLDELLEATMTLQHADFGYIQILDDETATLKIVAHRGVGPDFLKHFRTVDASNSSACGMALKTGLPVGIEDVTTDLGYARHRSTALELGFRGAYSTPIFKSGTSQLIGMLSILFRMPHKCTTDELRIADRFAHQAANVIHSRIVDQRLRESESRLSHLIELRTGELKRANASLREEMDKRQRVSERLELLRAELFHASRFSVAGQMAAMIAHELSQPLAAVVNSVNAIRRLLVSSEPGAEVAVRELAEDISTQAERAHDILSRLRHFIRRGKPDRAVELIKPLVEEAVAFATTGPDALGVSTNCYFDPKVSSVLVDPVQIQQVITNLVRNALHAMKDSPRADLSFLTRASSDDLLEIVVTDSGSGVPEEFRSELFEPFQSTKQGGMGLGLSICRTIVESHGGRIKFDPAFGGGSAFSFTIPVAMGEMS